MPNQRSFTVIELLVVLAVIALLASIILVSLSGTRDRAQIVKTLLYSNQIYHALGADIAGNWNFDEGTGTTAIDSSGYYNTGTIKGAIYTDDTPYKAAGQGQGKYALSFDGVDDGVDIAASSVFDSSQFTIAYWIKVINLKSGDWANNMVMGREQYGVKGFRHGIYSDGIMKFWTNQSGGNLNLESTKTVSSDRFYYVAVTYNGTTGYFYIDGVLAGSANGTYIVPSGVTLTFLERSAGGTTPANAIMDEVRIYSAALTTAEIQQHYAEGLKTHQDLVIK